MDSVAKAQAELDAEKESFVNKCSNLLSYYEGLSVEFSNLYKRYMEKLSNNDPKGAFLLVEDIELCRKRLEVAMDSLLESAALIHLMIFSEAFLND